MMSARPDSSAVLASVCLSKLLTVIFGLPAVAQLSLSPAMDVPPLDGTAVRIDGLVRRIRRVGGDLQGRQGLDRIRNLGGDIRDLARSTRARRAWRGRGAAAGGERHGGNEHGH